MGNQLSQQAAAELPAGTKAKAAVTPTPRRVLPFEVKAVLGSSGQALDPAARAFLGPRFGQSLCRACVYGPQSPPTADHAGGQLGISDEREADRVAEQVMQMPEPGALGAAASRYDFGPVGVRPGPNATASAPALHARALLEPRVGYDFGEVRVHTDAKAAASARALHARAFTFGREIVFGAGQYAPQTAAGRRLLAHELTHVTQQDRGLVAVQRQPLPPSPTPTPPAWLAGVPNLTHVQGQVWRGELVGYDYTYFGPYGELAAFLKTQGWSSKMQAHHIVGNEYLEDLGAPYTYSSGPCVALDTSSHDAVTSTVAMMKKHELGGPATATRGRSEVTPALVSELWANVYRHVNMPGLIPVVTSLVGPPVTIVSGPGSTPAPPLMPSMPTPPPPPSTPRAPSSAPQASTPTPSSARLPGLGGVASGLALGAVVLVPVGVSMLEEYASAKAEAEVERLYTPEIQQQLEDNPTTHGLIIRIAYQHPPPEFLFNLPTGINQFMSAWVEVVEGTTVEEARAQLGTSMVAMPPKGQVRTDYWRWVPPLDVLTDPVDWKTDVLSQ